MQFKRPIVSTSANISGKPAPALYDEISAEIKDGVDYKVKWRQEELSPGKPSSIIELGIGGEFKILRR
jgi:L-threonylcarbamoyladenylate synthase